MKSIAIICTLACLFCLEHAPSSTCFAQPSTDSSPKPIATVSTGQLRGNLTYDGVAIFKNIPFAEAPVGNLRWREPLPPKAWTGVRDATTFGSACYQTGHLNAVSSEDCLQLNVWTPKWPVTASVPVMVWFHGGGNVAGSAIEPLFNGEEFTRHGVVLVSANYRLGVFGFFAHPELTKESSQHSSGNYALLDQIQALRWVQENIAKFGGDPANVTIFGESAGSMDVNTLLTMPMSKGLFARAIAESGAAGDAQPLAESEKSGLALATKLSITGDGALTKLRSLSSEDLLKVTQQGPGSGGGMLGINVDGWVLPESPAQAFASGHELPVPLLFGNNSQELQKPFGPMADDLRTAISKRFGPLTDRALAAYGLNGTADPQPDPEFGTVGAQWATDSTFRCATVQELVWHTAAGNAAYQYQFSRTVHGKESEGAPHAAEIPFVFGTLPAWQEMRHYDVTDRQYSPVVQQYWVNFAKSGDPNGAGLALWPKFDQEKRAYLDLMDSGPVTKEGLRRQVCDVYAENQKRQMAR
jgi:para-nitrobenzyl esterase